MITVLYKLKIKSLIESSKTKKATSKRNQEIIKSAHKQFQLIKLANCLNLIIKMLPNSMKTMKMNKATYLLFKRNRKPLIYL